MPYQLSCEGATSAPVITGAAVDACTDAGGTLSWVEQGALLPQLTLEEGGLLGVAFIGLWALAWAIRAIRKQIEES